MSKYVRNANRHNVVSHDQNAGVRTNQHSRVGNATFSNMNIDAANSNSTVISAVSATDDLVPISPGSKKQHLVG